jgi:hypothetical protein
MTVVPFPKDAAKELQLTKELREELQAAQAARMATEGSRKLDRRAKKGAKFVMLPYARTMAAAGKMKCATMAVMVELAYHVFETHKLEVPLSNSTLRAIGVSHQAKLRALRQLETAGMVKVSGTGRGKSPLVTVLWAGETCAQTTK